METFTDFLKNNQSGAVDTSNIHVVMDSNRSMLELKALQLLRFFLRLKKPKKVLEIGVGEGGGTMHILDELQADAVLYSVDYEMRRKSIQDNQIVDIGHYATDYYDEKRHPRWVKFFGRDISECIEEIGPGVDCVILDTVHSLPGEVLSYLAILPFCDDQCLLMLDDISLHSIQIFKRSLLQTQCFCNHVLFSSILSQHKFTSENELPNFGCIVLNKQMCLRNIDLVMNCLFIPWNYIPKENIFASTLILLKKNYDHHIVDLYKSSYRAQLKRLYNGHDLRAYADIGDQEVLSELADKEVYFFGVGAAYEHYKHLFAKARPRAALVSTRYAGSPPDAIDDIPIRVIDEVLTGNNDIVPIILFSRREHAERMVYFLEEKYPAWAGGNIFLMILEQQDCRTVPPNDAKDLAVAASPPLKPAV